jgi:hypothetical protein
LETAEGTIARAEGKTRPLARGSGDLTADAMKAESAEAENLVKQAEGEQEQALEKLKQVETDCAAEEGLQGSQERWRREVPRLKQRHQRNAGQIEKVDSTIKAAVEKIARKEYAELEQRRVESVRAIRTLMAEGKTGEQLFDNINGEGPVKSEKFVEFLQGLSDLKLGDGQAEALFKHFAGEAGEISKERFLEVIRLYYKCVKSTVLSEDVSIKSKTIRRVDVGEVLEALSAPAKEDGANVQRVRCQSVQDDAIGWVTIAGNQGTPFLEPGGNVLTCVKETVITDGLSVQDSKTIRRVSKGEVIEVLEFPKKDSTLDIKRIRGKSKLDGAEGWITVQGNQGTAFLE